MGKLLSLAIRPLAKRLLTFEGCNFAEPPGEPAIVPPDSVSWRVFANPVSVYIGGVAAVLLEFGEPRVRSGVWNHSSFRSDPRERMRRTGAAAMLTVYGARSELEELSGRVNRIHAQIEGVTASGEPYRADDPDLLLWVQATASYAFLTAYSSYVRPVSAAERNLYYEEATAAAALYKVADPPKSEGEVDALFEGVGPRLEPSPAIREFLQIMRQSPILPLPLRPLQRLVVRAAVEIVPRPFRARMGLAEEPGLTPAQRRLVKLMARAADRIHVPTSPWAQAAKRLGLPRDFLERPASRPASCAPPRS